MALIGLLVAGGALAAEAPDPPGGRAAVDAKVVSAAFPGYEPRTGATEDPQLYVTEAVVHSLGPGLFVALISVAQAPRDQEAHYTGGARATLVMVRQQPEGLHVVDQQWPCQMSYDGIYSNWREAQVKEPWTCTLDLRAAEIRSGEWALSITERQGSHHGDSDYDHTDQILYRRMGERLVEVLRVRLHSEYQPYEEDVPSKEEHYKLRVGEAGRDGFRDMVIAEQENGRESKALERVHSWNGVSYFGTVRPVAVRASSQLGDPRRPDAYAPERAVDGNPATVWAEGVKGAGADQWLELEFERPISINRIWMASGHGRSKVLHRQNNRPKVLTLVHEDSAEKPVEVTLQDSDGWQPVSVGFRKPTARLRLRLGDVFRGSKYDDTCIAEVLVEERSP